ncbi:MAG TPA: hypothetical protein VHZ31_07700 [Solirubrobacteraceae bacterium]|nr:hypothetical protein [Solirubrobacteraceae bacterium]
MATAIDRAAAYPMTWPVASGSLIVGFAVAEASGVRPLGGIVLALGAGWCALRWRRRVGTGRMAALIGVYLVAFAGSHLIGHTVGTWPAVFIAAALAGGSALLVADLPAARAAVAP